MTDPFFLLRTVERTAPVVVEIFAAHDLGTDPRVALPAPVFRALAAQVREVYGLDLLDKPVRPGEFVFCGVTYYRIDF